MHLADPASAGSLDDRFKTLLRHVRPERTRPGARARPGAEREQVLAMGAAILDLRAAAAHFGYACDVHPQIHPLAPGLTADVTLREEGAPEAALAVLYRLVLEGRGHTSEADPRRPAEAGLGRLRNVAEGGGSGLCLVRDRWSGDGIARLVDDPVAHQATAFVVVTSPDTVEGWLDAGQRLERFVLAAAALGFRSTQLPQAIRDPDRRRRLRALLGLDSWPQAVACFVEGRREYEEAIPPDRKAYTLH